MRNSIVRAARTVGALAAGLLGTAALAQAPRPVSDQPNYPVKSEVTRSPEAARPPAGVNQVEIYEGQRRTVSYVAPNLSPSEQAALRELARAENEATYADDLLALKRLYVNSEQTLEPYRRFIQQQLYGFSTQSTYSGYVSSGFGGGGYYPYAFGNTYGYGGGGGYFGGASTTVSRSLANGMGDEGVMKAAMARRIADDAGPEYASAVAHNSDFAKGRIAASDRLAKSFGIIGAGLDMPRIILTLKSGEKLDGQLHSEDADWFRVQTPTSTVSVRKADVTRVEVPKK